MGVTVDTIMSDIREIIRQLVKEKAPIRKVASDLGLDHANLIRMLRTNSNPGLKIVEKIVYYLGCDLKLVKRKEVKSDKPKSSRSGRQRRKGHGSL